MEFSVPERLAPPDQQVEESSVRRSRLYHIAHFVATGGYSLLEKPSNAVEDDPQDPVVEAVASGGYSLLR